MSINRNSNTVMLYCVVWSTLHATVGDTAVQGAQSENTPFISGSDSHALPCTHWSPEIHIGL